MAKKVEYAEKEMQAWFDSGGAGADSGDKRASKRGKSAYFVIFPVMWQCDG